MKQIHKTWFIIILGVIAILFVNEITLFLQPSDIIIIGEQGIVEIRCKQEVRSLTECPVEDIYMIKNSQS